MSRVYTDSALRVTVEVNTGSCILTVSDTSCCPNRFQLSEIKSVQCECVASYKNTHCWAMLQIKLCFWKQWDNKLHFCKKKKYAISTFSLLKSNSWWSNAHELCPTFFPSRSPSFPLIQDTVLKGKLSVPELRVTRLMNRSISCTMKNPKGELFSYPPNSQVRSQSGRFSTRTPLRFGVRYLSCSFLIWRVTLLTHTWNTADIETLISSSKSSTIL